MSQPTHRYILKWSKKHSSKILHLAFEREDKSSLSFKAGQFITLHIDDSTKIIHRCYSIASVPEQNHIIEIVCSYVEGGVATNLLFSLNPGDSILASGPYGSFVLNQERPARYVLIATGTGISPYRSMLNEIKNKFENTHLELEITIVYGIRNRSELMFKDEFIQLIQQYPRFNFLVCYSKEILQVKEPFEYQGYVQDRFESLNLNPKKDIVYLCGNPNMINNSVSLLIEKGFDRQNIRREKYISPQ